MAALLDKALEGHETLLTIIDISGTGIALIIHLSIGCLFYKMHRNSRTGQAMKYIFLLSLLCACLYSSCHLAGRVHDLVEGRLVQFPRQPRASVHERVRLAVQKLCAEGVS